MFIREDLILAQFRLKKEIHFLQAYVSAHPHAAELKTIIDKLKVLQQKLEQVKDISKY